MGGGESKNLQEQKFISEHPSFKDAKVVSDKEAKWIQAGFKVQNEQYDEWHKGLESGKSRLVSDYLLLPEKTNFKHDAGLCGNTGTLTVPISPSRTITPTTPSYSPNLSSSVRPTRSSSRSPNSGTSSTPWQLLARTSRATATNLAT